MRGFPGQHFPGPALLGTGDPEANEQRFDTLDLVWHETVFGRIRQSRLAVADFRAHLQTLAEVHESRSMHRRLPSETERVLLKVGLNGLVDDPDLNGVIQVLVHGSARDV